MLISSKDSKKFNLKIGGQINVKDSLDFAKKLAPNVVGCKYTDSDLGDVGLIANAGYTCLLGADTMVLPGLVAGA